MRKGEEMLLGSVMFVPLFRIILSIWEKDSAEYFKVFIYSMIEVVFLNYKKKKKKSLRCSFIIFENVVF